MDEKVYLPKHLSTLTELYYAIIIIIIIIMCNCNI
jgi:hypothetical protein